MKALLHSRMCQPFSWSDAIGVLQCRCRLLKTSRWWFATARLQRSTGILSLCLRSRGNCRDTRFTSTEIATCMMESSLSSPTVCIFFFRCTTAASMAFTKANRRRSRRNRSRSWHSVGTVARDGCRASSPTAATTPSSGSLIIKDKVPQAKARDLRLLKGVCTDDSYVMGFVNQTFSSLLSVFSEEYWFSRYQITNYYCYAISPVAPKLTII